MILKSKKKTMILPFAKGNIKITSPYGNRKLWGVNGFHDGLDIVGVKTDEVVSVSNGTVLWSKIVIDKNNPLWEWGNYVAIMGDDGNTCYYCHLATRKVVAGQKVKAGDVIGTMGNTGNSFGKHLHFEVRPSNLKPTDAAKYLNLPNAVCEISENEYYADEVCKTCGFTDGTFLYINNYPWSADLWRKLAIFIRQGNKGDKQEIVKSCKFLPHTVNYVDKYNFADEFWKKVGNVK